ncbi:DMT family transporter [Novosphingobium tardum]|uniref:DMT family transporter n=1 Tax=Novosphingobium tardum TaxID=1538021 RepID=A0ABV8RN29_9SPHN
MCVAPPTDAAHRVAARQREGAIDVQRRENAGLLFALAGFVLLSLGDSVIKTIAGAWPGTAVALTRYAIGVAMLGAMLAGSQGRAGFRMVRPRWHVLRGFSVALATICFFSSLFLMPQAEATALTFTSPILTALLSPLLLGERLNRASFAALALGFVGAVIVLRPTFLAVGAAALLPLLSALGMSLLMIGNRAVAGTQSALSMQFFVALLALPVMAVAAMAGHLSGFPPLHIGLPDWTIVARCAIVAVTATTAHWLLFMAAERASAARIAPMTYVQLLVALVVGYAVFGDLPDALSLLGAAVIVGAGLLLWRSGRTVVATTD